MSTSMNITVFYCDKHKYFFLDLEGTVTESTVENKHRSIEKKNGQL